MVAAGSRAESRTGQYPLRKKLLRDLKGSSMQILAMVLLCFFGMFVFAGDARERFDSAHVDHGGCGGTRRGC